MATRCSLVLVALLLAPSARGAESTATFRVGVRVVRPFAVRPPAAGSAVTWVERGGARTTYLARVMPPATASGGAVLAGARGEIQLPCDARGCEVAVPEAGGRTVLLTVFPDGAPVALVER
ncbi:MAG TPA: hypothetical protein VF400_15075 [Anaeromyxobacteraceae bacterium]